MPGNLSRRKAIKLILSLIIPAIVTILVVFLLRIFKNSFPSDQDRSRTFGQQQKSDHKDAPFTEDLDGIKLEMMYIDDQFKDKFKMGSPVDEIGRNPDEGPQHQVNIKPFYMGKYSVTQDQWEKVAQFPKVKLDLNPKPSTFGEDFRGKGNLPVETISWEEAEEFCKRLSQKSGYRYRLPSEAEWEYACRAGTTTPFYFEDEINPDLANYDVYYAYGTGERVSKDNKEEYKGKTIPVNQLQVANEFKLESLHGNVWEWCSDTYHPNYENAPEDGRAWIDNNSEKRVIRGGAWNSFPSSCRSASRNFKPQKFKSNSIGFRVVCEITGD